jgi:Flp pilus assembly secretin CpaC
MNQPAAQKLRRFQFTLGQLLALTLGVALGFAPLKVWELTARAKPHVFVELKLLEVPVAEVPAMGLSLAKNGLISVQLKSGSDDWTKVRDVKVVAEPVLATLSGRPTSFNVGGDVPVPVTDKNGLTSIEYREYGTHVDVLPTILRNGRIEMEIVTKVSSVTMPPDGEEGSTLPVFHSVSSSTEIEVADGRTVVFGGLQIHPDQKSDRGAWVFVVTVRSQHHR